MQCHQDLDGFPFQLPLVATSYYNVIPNSDILGQLRYHICRNFSRSSKNRQTNFKERSLVHPESIFAFVSVCFGLSSTDVSTSLVMDNANYD